MQRGKGPYSKFGQRLSEIRKSLSESIIEVSGAVEVDTETITRYENGEDRPSEDLLYLLISHFDVKDEEADELFELAGYSLDDSVNDSFPSSPIVMVQMEARTLYTDSASIEANDNGLVLSFLQNGSNSQQIPVSKVGMSLTQAKKLLAQLQQSIQNAETGVVGNRLLIAPSTKKSSKKSEKR